MNKMTRIQFLNVIDSIYYLRWGACFDLNLKILVEVKIAIRNGNYELWQKKFAKMFVKKKPGSGSVSTLKAGLTWKAGSGSALRPIQIRNTGMYHYIFISWGLIHAVSNPDPTSQLILNLNPTFQVPVIRIRILMGTKFRMRTDPGHNTTEIIKNLPR
jgi:hypothetical protein